MRSRRWCLQLLHRSVGFRPPLRLQISGVCLSGLNQSIVTGDKRTVCPHDAIRCFPEMGIGELRACFCVRDVRAMTGHRARKVSLV